MSIIYVKLLRLNNIRLNYSVVTKEVVEVVGGEAGFSPLAYLVVSFIEDLFDLQVVPGVDDDRLRGSDEVAVVADLRGHLQPLLVHLEHYGWDPVPRVAAVPDVGGEGQDVLVP